ncbi:MAG: aminoglycoside phosphotransferase family protein [Bacteroidales bacterium]|nr:aminoglycoside phosphotransferase family protein [Bacteroidales bacterium]
MKTHIDIVNKFDIRGTILNVEPLGSGLINDTFRVKTDGPEDYVLQRINNAIFRDVELLQSNIVAVTDHLRKKLLAGADADRHVLRFISLKTSAKTYFLDGEGKYWRMSVFIKDSFTHDVINAEYSFRAGKAFGNFQDQLSDLHGQLGETIPDFHNMELRARQLEEAVAADAAGRLSKPEVQEILARLRPWTEEMCKAERLHREGVLPKRICHCDTKVNNVLFDADGNILCVIDLDTVMPSFVFSDFGDFLRTAANTAAEDEPDLSKISFNMEVFKAFAKGYLSEAHFLTKVEVDNLPYAVQLFPYMQAVRFFADYLNGDTYYKIKYPEHNLVRTLDQLKLFDCVNEALPEISAFIQNNI